MAIPNPLYRVDTTASVVYLTFDDGPYLPEDGRSSNTDALLQVLSDLRKPKAEGGVNDVDLSATFFSNGWTLVQNTPYDSGWQPFSPIPIKRRNIARRILDDGHDLANHSHHHRNPWGKLEKDKKGVVHGTPRVSDMLSEIGLTSHALSYVRIHNTNGAIRRYFRAPGDPSYWPVTGRERGSQVNKPAGPVLGTPANPPKQSWFQKCVVASSLAEYTYVSFNIFARDDGAEGAVTAKDVYDNCIPGKSGRRGNPDKLSFDRLSTTNKKGAIILMHNGRKWTDDALPGVVKYIYSKGFVVRKLPAGL